MGKDKRYLVFTYDDFYPSGGMTDLKESFDDIDEALEFIKNQKYVNAELYDRIDGSELDYWKLKS